ncbi:MAG TPA: TetR family transcriptional regulator [Solirubrobacterales bacterium]|nr:TetR family transcriptional regulator [Solirubrobacterales bacterium]
MSAADVTTLAPRPKRADARRNYDKLVSAAREAFAEKGTSATLEDVARRAGVGIGTLYRHFPTRQDLLEAVYLEGVEGICRAVENYEDLPPWEALSGWLHEFVGFAATKRALAEDLLAYIDRDAKVFTACGGAIFAAGEPLLKRAQDAGVVRPDADIADVTKMVSGIAAIRTADAEQIDRILGVALDGLRDKR